MMDKLHWILLIIALGAVALVVMLGLIMIKENKPEASESIKTGRRVVVGHSGNVEFNGSQEEYEAYRVVENAIKDADEVSNMFDRFKYDIDNGKYKTMSHTKPKVEVKRAHKDIKYYHCESKVKGFRVIGVGKTPKEAYEDWLNFSLQYS